MADTYDVIVIGAGPVGENVAARAVRGGLTAALIESELVGGECSYWACMPSKALLRPGLALSAAQRVAGAREAATGILKASAVLKRRDSFTSHWDDAGQVKWATDAGIEVVKGHGRLSGERQVEVTEPSGETKTLTARHAVVLCTGSIPAVPPIDGLADVETWTSREATSAEEVPGRLGIIGGGVVGCEMAQAWARLGSTVTLFAHKRLLPKLEEFAGKMVVAGLNEDGVTVVLNETTKQVSGEPGAITVQTDKKRYEFDQLLVSTGRRATTDDIGLSAVGLEDGQKISVDDHGLVQEGGYDWLYAAGDVAGRAQLTHQGKYEARVVGDVIAARAKGEAGAAKPKPWSAWSFTADHAAVPAVVFTDPEVASVGLTAASARDRGIDVKVIDIPIAVAGSSLQADNYQGRASLIIDEERHVIVGATFVGQDIAELLHSATIAVVGEVPLERLWHAVPSYPTISEVWLRLLETYGL